MSIFKISLALTGSATLFLLGCTGEPQISFKQVVNPIVNTYCSECHLEGGEGVEKSGFRIDSYENIMKGTRFGPVIVAGDAESSTLYRMVAGKVDESIRMPHGKDPLTKSEIATIEKWIQQGAKNN